MHDDAPSAAPATAGLVETSTRLGRLRWMELRLFEILGSWVPGTDEPEISAFLARTSYHHAWHADLWLEHLPTLWGEDAETLTSPGPGGAALCDALTAGATGSVERLVGTHRVVLPRLLIAYRSLVASVPVAAAGPLRRWSRLVIEDLRDDWATGEMLLQGLLDDDAALDRAHARHREIEGFATKAANDWTDVANLATLRRAAATGAGPGDP
ncbi:MAG: hypothetical protein S0880_22750 [Actinomycetota bacterium]|nr:hypothetical protein [Actinomycetota bacterium]